MLRLHDCRQGRYWQHFHSQTQIQRRNTRLKPSINHRWLSPRLEVTWWEQANSGRLPKGSRLIAFVFWLIEAPLHVPVAYLTTVQGAGGRDETKRGHRSLPQPRLATTQIHWSRPEVYDSTATLLIRQKCSIHGQVQVHQQLLLDESVGARVWQRWTKPSQGECSHVVACW